MQVEAHDDDGHRRRSGGVRVLVPLHDAQRTATVPFPKREPRMVQVPCALSLSLLACVASLSHITSIILRLWHVQTIMDITCTEHGCT